MLRFVKLNLLVIGLVLGLNPSVWATPAQVIIIRHAEKMTDGDENLSPRGLERARALVGFFSTNSEVLKFGSIAGIFATRPKKGGSVRAIQTVTPLAESLGLEIRDEFKKRDVTDLVDSVMQDPTFDGRTVVIAWRHGQIPELAQAFGCTTAPVKWDENTFDRAWIIRYGANRVSGFLDIPQNILPGDSVN